MANILWLEKIRQEHKELVGEKALGIAELYNLKLPVPEAFVISSEVFSNLIKHIDVSAILNKISDENSLKQAENEIKNLILRLEFPDQLKLEIGEAYKKLDSSFEGISENFDFIKASRDPLFVVVRSSSHNYVPFQQNSFLGVKGLGELMNAIKHCWASLFNAQAIAYTKSKGLPIPSISVIVQKMINATRSGNIFTTSPTSAENILIEAEYGYSKGSDPSQFFINKATLAIVNSKLKNQQSYFSRDGSGRIIKQALPISTLSIIPLLEDDCKALANMAKKVEEHFGGSQIISWAAENKKLYLLQTQKLDFGLKVSGGSAGENMILKGLPLVSGSGSGVVSIVNSKEEADNFSSGILVTYMTNPYLVSAMQKADAVVVEGCGLASHAVYLSKELDKPCLIGAENAASVLNNGDEISIDENGFIYREAQPEAEGAVPLTNQPADLNEMFEQISQMERQVTELVYQDADRRRAGQIEDKAYSQMLSSIEWDIREIRKKIQNYLSKP